ncbi:hypothetical protein DCAR_0207072 [Daucus carota subsp. sativus]|uniref:Hexosyltransferase n=1 Tax=Daucus carota subsp. sativus TaxID=79200 RepID=A0AAF1APQ7_DAUCS|nr:hypothetical protein DCAR_0207072 [Daucus carota subsp. sativus]
MLLIQYPVQDIDIIVTYSDISGDVQIKSVKSKDLSASWVWKNPIDDHTQSSKPFAKPLQFDTRFEDSDNHYTNESLTGDEIQHPAKLRLERRKRRTLELIEQGKEIDSEMNAAAAEQARTLDTTVMGRYSIWRTKYENPNSDSTLKVSSVPNLSIIHVGFALDRAKEMGHILALAKDQLYDCIEVARTLRAMLQMKETNVLEMKKKSAFLTQLAAKTVPRPLHCLPLLLATDYLLHCLPLKILFLNDDIVVQKDLTPLWSVDLKGMVNGAIEACKESFHRLDKYLSFSNPNIYENFDPNACGWAFGMNMFDLKEWRLRNITGIYRRSQDMNEDRTLWKPGTLPPGLITFYNLTYPLDRTWHVLGLGYDPALNQTAIQDAGVVHYNGNYKPWLDLATDKYRSY